MIIGTLQPFWTLNIYIWQWNFPTYTFTNFKKKLPPTRLFGLHVYSVPRSTFLKSISYFSWTISLKIFSWLMIWVQYWKIIQEIKRIGFENVLILENIDLKCLALKSNFEWIPNTYSSLTIKVWQNMTRRDENEYTRSLVGAVFICAQFQKIPKIFALSAFLHWYAQFIEGNKHQSKRFH